MSFHDSSRFIFEFLLKLAHISRLKVFMQYLRFFGFLYEQWSQIGVGIEKIGRIQTCQIFGSADGPRVIGGQSAVNWTCSPEALQRSCQPQKFIADSPQKDRGRSAHVGQRKFSQLQCKKFQRRTVRQRTADSPRLDRIVGSAWLDLYWMSPSPPPPNRIHTPKVSLSFSLKHVGKATRSSPFGVVPGRSEHIPGLFSR